MITAEQVADLREGDEVQLVSRLDTVITGRLRSYGIVGETALGLGCGLPPLRTPNGCLLGNWVDEWTLTVVERAPRPLYVNHPRTEPVPGDIVRIELDDGAADDVCVNTYLPIASRPHDPWLSIYNTDAGSRYPTDMVIPGRDNNARGRAVLLVDGETGQVVPS